MNSAIYLEIRREYTEHLVDLLGPLIYEGLKNIYETALNLARDAGKVESTLTVYQECLRGIPDWSEKKITTETNRFRQACGISQGPSRTSQSPKANYGVLDDLVKAVIKSNILLLCHSNEVSSDVARLFYDTFRTESLIHQCYIECGKEIHNQPFLFYFDPDGGKVDYMRNQVIVMRKVEDGIGRATRKIIPLNLILKEFLINTYEIFAEPVKVELVAANGSKPSQPETKTTQPARPAPRESSEKPLTDLDAQIKELLEENTKMGHGQKVEEIMAYEKLIQTPRTPKPNPTAYDRKTATKPLSGQGNIYEGVLSGKTGKKSADFDNQATAEDTAQITEISFSQGVLGAGSSSSRPRPSRAPADSEKVDPRNARFIERYGNQSGGRR